MFVLMLGIGMHVVQKRTLSFKELGTGGAIWNFGIHRFSKVGYIRSLIWKWPTKLCTFCRSFSEISLPVPNWALISEIHGFQISLSFRLYPTSRKSKVPFLKSWHLCPTASEGTGFRLIAQRKPGPIRIPAQKSHLKPKTILIISTRNYLHSRRSSPTKAANAIT